MDALSPINLPFLLKTSLSLNLFSKSFTVVLIKSRWSASILCSQKIPSKPSAQAHSNTFNGFDYDLKKLLNRNQVLKLYLITKQAWVSSGWVFSMHIPPFWHGFPLHAGSLSESYWFKYGSALPSDGFTNCKNVQIRKGSSKPPITGFLFNSKLLLRNEAKAKKR